MPKTIFISWSGDRSKHIAQALKDWLKKVFRKAELELFISTEIEVGTLWSQRISQSLEKADYGILCLTEENLNEPWILFEAGALSKMADRGRVIPYLLYRDLSPLKDPLARFHAVNANKDGTWELVSDLCKLLELPASDSDTIKETFDELMWEKLRERLDATPSPREIPTSERSNRAILEEIMEHIRCADVRKYLAELKKPPSERSIGRDELPIALNTVVRWVLHQLKQELGLESARGPVVDYVVTLREQKVLIESKMGNLLREDYRRDALTTIREARDDIKSDASAIIVIPDDPDVAGELNDKKCLEGLQFCPASKLKEKLLEILKRDAAQVP